MKKCFQVLFNRPLEFKDEVIYGFRVPYDEAKAKYLIDYAVDLIGQWCFQQHGGKMEDFTRLYSYTATLDTRTYFRVDEWWLDDNYDIENEVKITDLTEYFNTRCVLQEQDYKTGYNGWLQIYQKLLSRYQTLTQLGLIHTDKLPDYKE
ncbi:MAG: hypothetical protein IKV77_11670 [Alistipes sp.]|nr:hypothetical protein [Alistipes sp.]